MQQQLLSKIPSKLYFFALLALLPPLMMPLYYQADDFVFLVKLQEKILSPSDFGALLSRTPIFALLQAGIYPLAEYLGSFRPFVLIFWGVVQSSAIFLLARILGLGLGSLKKTSFLIAAGALLFYPNNFEMQFWLQCLPYGLGITFLAAAFYFSRTRYQIIALVLCFLTYDSWVFPSLALFGMRRIFQETEGKILIGRTHRVLFFGDVKIWFKSVLIAFLIRFLLGLQFGNFHYDLPADFSQIGENIFRTISSIFVIQFYKANWVSTFLEIGALAALTYQLRLKNFFIKRRQPMILLMVAFSAAFLILLNYSAPRAFSGVYLVRQVVIASFILWALENLRGRYVQTLVTLIFLAYGIQWAVLAARKQEMAREYEVVNTKAVALAKTCTEECMQEVRGLVGSLDKDWILPAPFDSKYFEYIVSKNGLRK